MAKAGEKAWTEQTTSALMLGFVHALVDASCGFLIFRYVGHGRFEPAMIMFLVVLYNSLAFGGQWLIGALADWFDAYRFFAIVGTVLCAVALPIAPSWTLHAIIVIGTGNACFHVGAGALVLKSSGDRATESGVFVGPGAVGLSIGILLGANAVPCIPHFLLLFLLAAVLIFHVGRPLVPMSTDLPRVAPSWVVFALLCGVCLLGSVTVRALVGGSVAGTWRGVSTDVMAWLAVAACAGKMCGGFMGDRIGWLTTSVLALALSAPLVALFPTHAHWAVVGMFIFQLTMAITLKAMHHLIPGQPGLAFGLPCLALLLGALPGLLGYGHHFADDLLVLSLAGVSIVLVTIGLRMLVRMGGATGPGPELVGRLHKNR